MFVQIRGSLPESRHFGSVGSLRLCRRTKSWVRACAGEGAGARWAVLLVNGCRLAFPCRRVLGPRSCACLSPSPVRLELRAHLALRLPGGLTASLLRMLRSISLRSPLIGALGCCLRRPFIRWGPAGPVLWRPSGPRRDGSRPRSPAGGVSMGRGACSLLAPSLRACFVAPIFHQSQAPLLGTVGFPTAKGQGGPGMPHSSEVRLGAT